MTTTSIVVVTIGWMLGSVIVGFTVGLIVNLAADSNLAITTEDIILTILIYTIAFIVGFYSILV